MPTIEVLRDLMVQSLGGEANLRAHRHRTLSGTTELVGLPMKGNFVQRASAPDKLFIAFNLGDLTVTQGYDGTVAWAQTSMNGLQILDGPMAETIKEQARFYGPVELGDSSAEIALRWAWFDDKECIELKLIGHDKSKSYLYVDGNTWLVAGSKRMITTPIGIVESKTYNRNYRGLSGYMTPTEILIESSLQRQQIKIERISFETISPALYHPPS